MPTKRSLLLLYALSMLTACGSGTRQPEPIPRCDFDQDVMTRIESTPETLPPSPAGDLGTLKLNRVDSKEAFEGLRMDAQALASEARVCLKSQAGPAAPASGKSKLDQRLERIERRLK